MKLRDVFSVDAISLTMASTTKLDAIWELVQLLKAGYPAIDTEKTEQVLLERERLGSTAIGEGVAIPHGKLAGLDHVVGAFARSKEGVDFDAYDDKATHLFFVLLAPEGPHGVSDHLKVLAKISRMLRDAQFRERLCTLGDREQIYELLVNSDE